MSIKTFFLWCFSILCVTVHAQKTYNLKNPGEYKLTKCAACLQTLKTMPAEVQMGVTITASHEIFFIITDPAWFAKLFRAAGDGIAIDLISKDQYVCNGENTFTLSWASKGTLLEPVYFPKLKETAFAMEGYYVVKVGEVPAALWNKELEANILLIQNYNVCEYKAFFQLPTFGWGLLDMGLYLNKMVFKSDEDSLKTLYEKVFQKQFQFTIPFQKGKYEYSATDVKPVYDSLKLTDYDIKSITIRAYSSVEGTKEVNVDLQKKRAQSIVNALQGYQKSTIDMNIHASENWVEFLQDIKTTKYAAFASLTKDQIKEKLANKTIAAELEPILKKHRKAILYIELEKKNPYLDVSSEQLINQFNTSVASKDLQRAMEIQTVVYDRMKNAALAESYADRMEIPKKSEYSVLLNNKNSYNYLMYANTFAALQEFQELAKLFPAEGRIRYNICVLKFKIWLQGNSTIKPDEFKMEIYGLNKYGIPSTLINRMLVNYYIIRGDLYMQQKDYINKDKCLNSIQSIYKNLTMTDDDIVSLAQYFSYYAKYDWATALLKSKINNVDVNEELLFYYLNLTIADPAYTDKPEYRAIMLNAVNINLERYCAAFNSASKGGITFQLLEDEYLKNTYCENCFGK